MKKNAVKAAKCFTTSEHVPVLYVLRPDAKRIKTMLEQDHLLHKDFRMTASVDNHYKETIAVPIVDSGSDDSTIKDRYLSMNGVVGTGYQTCPWSSAALGNGSARIRSASSKALSSRIESCLCSFINTMRSRRNQEPSNQEFLLESIRNLPATVCPRKLETFGDDRTVVIPRRALSTEEDTFAAWLNTALDLGEETKISAGGGVLTELWKDIASVHDSSRVVRRGEVDPESGIRESGFRLLWPHRGIPEDTGQDSPGWISVTENGIRQSFDLTRVMFSRGNITEKMRFGEKLVQRGDMVLDLYAGIGYFTLPALVHGQAQHVYACEWNEHAVNALRYNLADHGLEQRATVLQGDCRQSAKDNGLVDMFDRVSLGLLPSSEGGWYTAVAALKRSGGWLHVHANVPVHEVETWSLWLCHRLSVLAREEVPPPLEDWIVVCLHVEKVKSFAPTVNHYGPYSAERYLMQRKHQPKRHCSPHLFHHELSG